MYELDKANFGKFLAEQRKAKGYTQKTLAEKLFVSDKAVSKWERSLSMPDISLLIPLAEILEVSVTELLEGRRLEPDSEMNAGKVEELVKKALTLSEDSPASRQMRKECLRKNVFIFCSCAVCMILEMLAGIWLSTVVKQESESAFMAWLGGFISMLVLGGLSFSFGIYFWFFMKDRLPNYYDENQISVYTDGSFSLSMPGISFNNNSWPYMAKALRIWSAVTMVTVPLLSLLPVFLSDFFTAAWLPFCLQMVFMALCLAGMFVPLYVLNRKYGNPNAAADDGAGSAEGGRTAAGNRRKAGGIIFALTMCLLVIFVPLIAHSVGVTGSGIRVGCVQQYTMQEWSASYRRLDGTMSRTLYPRTGAGAYAIEIETIGGNISIEMTDSEGNVIFSGEDMQPGIYEITLSGTTRVKITGEDHSGSFSVFPQ